MALFQKQPIREELVVPYTLSMPSSKTALIVGLGNPGDNYVRTRHNMGFMALDFFAAQQGFPVWKDNKKWQASVTEHNIGGTRTILLKPATFMNDSGRSVQAVAAFYKIAPIDIVVVHDELSIDFGQIRTRIGGQAAGHNGIKSIMAAIDENFGRIRVGIKNDTTAKVDASNFVLGQFSKVEQSYLEDIHGEVAGILTEYLYGGKLPHDTRSIVFDYAD